jgi:hypothetical protein
MNNLKELEISEMIEISGGVNVAYEIGYAIGSTLRQILILKGLRDLLYI